MAVAFVLLMAAYRPSSKFCPHYTVKICNSKSFQQSVLFLGIIRGWSGAEGWFILARSMTSPVNDFDSN